MKTLYLCYFGIREPLVQTQVLPYLRALVGAGIDTHLLTFEAAGTRGCHGPEECGSTRASLAADGISWHRLRYHQRPSVPATLFDVAAGIARGAWLARRHGIDVFHARSHVPALMALALKRSLGGRFLFDFRGLMADEYVESGHWSRESTRYRLLKRLERTLLREADGIVMLTEQIREHFFTEMGTLRGEAGPARSRPVAVIPCCVDLERFRAAPGQRERIRRELALGPGTVLAYLGTVGGYYMTEELAELMAAALRVEPGARLLVLSQAGHEIAGRALERSGVPASAYCIRSVAPDAVPAYLSAADAGVSLREASFATTACSPTKIAEYLAAGLPILSNAGVGDTDRLVQKEGVGAILDALTPAAYESAFRELRALLAQAPAMRESCREAARRCFDLATVGGPAYVRLYQELMVPERELATDRGESRMGTLAGVEMSSSEAPSTARSFPG